MDGQGPQPFAYYLSRICDEFPSLSPSGVIDELARLPVGCLEEIIEARQYAHAKAMVDAADASGPDAVKRLPASEMVRLVRAIEFGQVNG